MTAAPKCDAELYLRDDHGDGVRTMRCGLHPGHQGQHQDTFRRDSSGMVTITWWRNEKTWPEEQKAFHNSELEDTKP